MIHCLLTLFVFTSYWNQSTVSNWLFLSLTVCQYISHRLGVCIWLSNLTLYFTITAANLIQNSISVGSVFRGVRSVFRGIKDSIFILIEYYIFKIIPLSNMQPRTIHTFLHINILIYIYIILQNRNVSKFYRGKIFSGTCISRFQIYFPEKIFKTNLTS